MPEDLRAYYNRKDAYICRENASLAPLADAGIINELREGFQALAPLYRFLLRAAASLEEAGREEPEW